MPPAKKQRVMQRYRDEYHDKWPCITAVPSSLHDANCSICGFTIKIGNGGKSDIQAHINSAKHQKNASAKQGTQRIDMFAASPAVKSNADLAVAKAEALFTAFLVEHNLPLSVADHAGPLFKEMFPDSAIAKKYKCGRTKTREVVTVLATEAREETIEAVQKQPFSLSTDGSNDKGSEQLYPVLVRYHDGTKVVTNVLSITTPDGNSTGREIFAALDLELSKAGLSWDNCVSFGSDNASVMLGRFNGVAACIKERNPNVLVQGCPCHLLHIAAKNGANTLRTPVEERLIDIYHYLDNSSKRQKNLQNFQRETGCALRKFLKHGATRWLSLLQCVNRLLELWAALSEFFEREKEEAGAKINPRLERILDYFRNRASKAYALFLSHSLPLFTEANLLLQKEEPVIHLLQPRLHDVATDLLVAFVKPSVITSCADLYTIEHGKRRNQKDREELSIGEDTRKYLEEAKSNGLSNTAITEFFEDARAFYSSALTYVFAKLPMKQEELSRMSVLNVGERANSKFADIRFWLSRFPCLATDLNVDKLQTEFAKFQVDKLAGWDLTERIDRLWGRVANIKDEDGNLKYCRLAGIMMGLLAVPHSNADSERVFSLVRKNKTESRASMSRQLLSDIISIKAKMLSSERVCHTYPLRKPTLLKVKPSAS